MKLTQDLPNWNLDAFEPYISTETMSVHVNQLHKGYVDKLNSRIPHYILSRKPSYVLKNIESFLEGAQRDFYRDMMGGNVAHTLFWKSISPTPRRPEFLKSIMQFTGPLKDEIVDEGLKRFGSGWVWGVITPEGRFRLYSTRNHDTPYMRGHTPVFCVDVWEHAYFLDQHGDRKAWLENICEFLDWEFIDQRVSRILGGRDDLDAWILGSKRK